jgi:hypothetical protein
VEIASHPSERLRRRRISHWLIEVPRSRAFRKLLDGYATGDGMDSERNVSAMTPRSLTWDKSAFARAPATHPRRRFENEAVAWQLASQRGGWAAFRPYVDQSVDRRARRKDPNRIAELHALIGAIGEQSALCLGFEQDAQRFDATRNKISDEHHRLVLRALSEAGGHFLLGAAHSLGNLLLVIPQVPNSVRDKAPVRAMTRGSPNRRAGALLPSSVKVGCAARSMAGLARTQS